MRERDKELVQVVPSERQLAFQQTEFYAFVHFTVNTYTGREWGDGTEDPAIFDPVSFCADQWVEAVRSAGMKGLILTCKHHDGFCLWPSRYTSHTIAASPYQNGKGDIVRQVSEACREGGIKFGIYLSPWDRNQPCYGSGKEYDDYFVGQLTELLTGYGEIFDVWFDGACGEGPNGKRQVYDWDRYYAKVRELQPMACISVCGPDVRWCGNECGDTRESEWSVVPRRTRDTERVAENSQQSDDTGFRERKITASDRDLGSRGILREEKDLIWYPAEVDASIRPGWFYHEEENDKLRTPEELFRMYLHSVGGNATLLLNIPPARDGLFHENDVNCLKELGGSIRKAFSHDLLEAAGLYANIQDPGYEIENVREDSYEAYFRTPEGQVSCEIEINFPERTELSYVVMKENIRCSQRIERFRIEDGDGNTVYRGTVVGYKKIVRLPEGLFTDALKIIIEDSRVAPTLSFLGVY